MGRSYIINGDKEFLKNEMAQMDSPLSGLMALHFKNGVLIRVIYSPTDMVIILNRLSSRRIQEAYSFLFLISPPFTSPLCTYLAQYLK